MFWGIDRDVWSLLWSGVLGSFVAAVVGGLVALFVVRLTNAHQTRLSREAREKAAMAELEASATQFVLEYGRKTDTTPVMHQMLAAAARWRIESANTELGDEIVEWPGFLVLLAVKALDEKKSGTGSDEAQDRLRAGLARVQLICSRWYRPSAGFSREAMIAELKRMRTEHVS